MRLTELSAGSSFVEIDADEDPWTSKEDGEAELSRDVDGNIVSASVPLSVFKRPKTEQYMHMQAYRFGLVLFGLCKKCFAVF